GRGRRPFGNRGHRLRPRDQARGPAAAVRRAVFHNQGAAPGSRAGDRLPGPVRPPRGHPARPGAGPRHRDAGQGRAPAGRPPGGRNRNRRRCYHRRRLTSMPFDLEDRLAQTPKPARGPAPLRELQSAGDIRLLILDDDPATCSVIQAALSNKDFQIDAVSDPALVESVLSKPEPYHLIVLDYVLPGLEPDQVFAWIRDYQPNANIVVVTGYPSVDSALNCLRA